MNTTTTARSCQPWPAPGPVTFRPGTCYSFAPHAAAWHMTAADWGWATVAWLAAGLVLAGILNWFSDRYEVAWCRHPPRLIRRWYGPRAHVSLRGEEDEDARYAVLAVDDEHFETPWLKVRKLNPEFLTYWDEDSGAFWAPVTRFAPYSVRRLRPVLLHCGRVPVPWLTRYLPLRQPVRYLEADA